MGRKEEAKERHMRLKESGRLYWRIGKKRFRRRGQEERWSLAGLCGNILLAVGAT